MLTPKTVGKFVLRLVVWLGIIVFGAGAINGAARAGDLLDPNEALVVLSRVWLFGLPVATVIGGTLDAAVKPAERWQRAGQSQVVWVLLQLLLPIIGTVAYTVWVRPELTGDEQDHGGDSTFRARGRPKASGPGDEGAPR